MADENPVLTEDHFVQIKEGLSRLDEADRAAERAIRAGIDMTDTKKQTAELRVQLTRLRNAYFPGRT